MTVCILRSTQSISTTSITVCIMERHQAGQEETLMEVKVKTDSLEAVHPPRGPPAGCCGCPKCAVTLATVMGFVIVALLGSFILHFVMFAPSCNQDASPLSPSKVVTTYNLTKSDEQRRYDIFTVDKAASYLVYGWVRFSDDTSEEVVLKQSLKGQNRTIKTKKVSERFVFFCEKVSPVNGVRISIYFESSYTDSLFHVYEL